MQLRLDAADRLVELVEDRRGPVQVDEAARLVLKLGSQVPIGLARSLLDEAVRDDARLRWAGDLVALSEAPAEATRARAGDVRRLRPRDDRAPAGNRAAVRDRRGARARARARGAVPDAREPGGAARSGDRRADRPSRRRVAARAARAGGGPAVSRLCRRCRPRRAQRALRHGVPRQRDDARRPAAASLPLSSTPSGSPVVCSVASLRTLRRSLTASRPTRDRAIVRSRTPRRPPRSCFA